MRLRRLLHDWSWAWYRLRRRPAQRRFVAEDEGELVAIAAAQVRGCIGRSFCCVPHGPVMDYEHPSTPPSGCRWPSACVKPPAATRRSR